MESPCRSPKTAEKKTEEKIQEQPEEKREFANQICMEKYRDINNRITDFWISILEFKIWISN